MEPGTKQDCAPVSSNPSQAMGVWRTGVRRYGAYYPINWDRPCQGH